MRWFLLILLVLSCTVTAQEQPSCVDFTAGLRTAIPLTMRQFGEAEVCHNIDLTLNEMSLTPRLGYTKVMDLPDVDSMLWNGFHSIDYRDGTKQWLVLGRWAGDSGFAGVFASGLDSMNFGQYDTLVLVPDVDAMLAAQGNNFAVGMLLNLPAPHTFRHIGYDTTGRGSGNYKADICDSFVNILNTTPPDSHYITASRDTDSLLLAEDLLTFSIGANYLLEFDTTRHAHDSPPTVVESRFPSVGRISVQQFRDRIQIMSTCGISGIYAVGELRDFPPRAPGVPSLMPLDTAGGGPTGAIRYALRYIWPDDSTSTDSILYNRIGPLSAPIRVNGNDVMIYNFPKPTRHTWYWDTIPVTDTSYVDTAAIEIWRTKGTAGYIDESDSLYLIDTVFRGNDAGDSAFTVSYTDTFTDGGLAGKTALPVITYMENRYSPGDTTDNDTIMTAYVYPGAPAIIDWTMKGDANPQGIWSHADAGVEVPWDTVVGFSWLLVAIDTNTSGVSDSSRSINMWQQIKTVSYGVDTGGTGEHTFPRNQTEMITLVMPPAPVGHEDIAYQLYRAPLRISLLDSTQYESYKWLEGSGGDHPGQGGGPPKKVVYSGYGYRADSIEVASYYYYIGDYSPLDTMIDSLPYDSLLLRTRYERSATPELGRSLIIAHNRSFVAGRGVVYISKLIDSLTRFDILEQIPLNPDDGDEITAMWASSQGVVHVAKHNKLYILYRQDGLWQTPELSAHYGVVAPFSVAHSPEGTFFLSWDGIRLLAESGDRVRSFDAPLISAGVASFDRMPITTLREAYGTWYDNKYILTFPSLDTAFVVNKITPPGKHPYYAISTWDLGMVGGDLSRVGVLDELVPGDSLYFIKSNDPGIYLYGSSAYDEGDDVLWSWRSGPTNQVDGFMRTLDEVSLYVESDDTVTNSIAFFGMTEKDSTANATAIFLPRLDSTRYHHYQLAPAKESLFWRLHLSASNYGEYYMTEEQIIRGLWLKTNKAIPYGSQ